MIKRALLFTLALGLALAFLRSPARADEPANLDLYKEQVRAYINSGEYARKVAEIALQANKYLVKRIAKGPRHGQKLAVVFDIDETTLTNLPHIIANDFGYVPKIWDNWVLEGQARAIIPVQTIYDTAIRGKVAVFFITSRPENTRASTEKNLREVGYDSWTKIFFMPPGDPGPSCLGFKLDTRRKLIKEGYDIVVNIGDQNCDLAGGYSDRFFKLPNPFYLLK